MDKKKVIEIVIKTVIYAAGLILAALGASAALSSCTVSRQSESVGKAIIITNDTTVINHHGSIKFPKN